MMEPQAEENTRKKLIIAIIISTIIVYLIIAYYDYDTYKYHNADFTVSVDFLMNTVEHILFRIDLAFRYGPMTVGVLPFLIILPIIYCFTFYKTYTSSKPTTIKFKLPLFIIYLVSLILFTVLFGDTVANF